MSTDQYGIGCVVNYCTNEYPFLAPCLAQLQSFCQRIVVPVCDHFFDGTAEDKLLLERSEAENRDRAIFLNWKFDRNEHTGDSGQFYWEGKARWLGVEHLQNCEFVLFLDVDEIVDSERFVQWLDNFKAPVEIPNVGLKELTFRDLDAFKFGAYWYFRDPAYQARVLEEAGVMVRRSRLTRDNVINPGARTSLFKMIEGIRGDRLLGLDGRPMVHHYSWVRTRQQMLKKVRSWGHAGDRNWEALIEREFRKPYFSGIDFIHHYRFNQVEPFVQINLADVEQALRVG